MENFEVSLESFRSFRPNDSICEPLVMQVPIVNGALHWTIRSNHRFLYLSFDVDTERLEEIMPPPQNHLKGFLTEFKGLLTMVGLGEDQDRDPNIPNSSA